MTILSRQKLLHEDLAGDVSDSSQKRNDTRRFYEHKQHLQQVLKS